MEEVPAGRFLRWAAGVGIGFDPRYPNSGCLSLLPTTRHARFWVLPDDFATYPQFAATLLEALDDWKTGYLWPRAGRWIPPGGSQSAMPRGAGIPFGSAAALHFGRAAESELVAILCAYLAFGGCTDDDLFFVPDHGRQLLQTDHHDVVHLKCRTKGRVLKLVKHMSRAGYELPAKLPDWTFKRPSWMDGA